MRPNARKISFGKFLTMCFLDDYFVVSPDAQDSKEKDSKENCCTHCIFRDHVRFFAYKDMVARFEYESLRSYEVRTCSVGRGVETAEKDVTVPADLNSRYLPTLKTEINELRQHLEQIVVKVGNKVQEAFALYEKISVPSAEIPKEIQTLNRIGESVEIDSDALRASLVAISTKENLRQLDLNAARRQLWLVSRTWQHKLIKLWPLGAEDVVVKTHPKSVKNSSEVSTRKSLPSEWNLKDKEDSSDDEIRALFDALAAKRHRDNDKDDDDDNGEEETTRKDLVKREDLKQALTKLEESHLMSRADIEDAIKTQCVGDELSLEKFTNFMNEWKSRVSNRKRQNALKQLRRTSISSASSSSSDVTLSSIPSSNTTDLIPTTTTTTTTTFTAAAAKRDTMSGVLSGFMKMFNGDDKAKSVIDEIMKISYPLWSDFAMSLSPSSENTVLLIRRNASEKGSTFFEFSNYELTTIIAYSLSSTEYDKEIRKLRQRAQLQRALKQKFQENSPSSGPVMNDEKKEEEEEVQVIRMRRDSKGRIGIKFDMEMNVCGVSSWAKQSGIRVGHKIVACEGIQIESHAELVSAIPSRGDNRAFSLHVKYIGVRRVRFQSVSIYIK